VSRSPDLPAFERPPVVEVGISLQFTPLELLRSPHVGLLWTEFRRMGLTHTEDHGEIEPAFEEFENELSTRVGIKFQMFDDAPPLPRVWFLNEGKNELVQIQRDRLIVNWRQGATPEPYPRYGSIISRFQKSLKILSDFVRLEKLGDIQPSQCELTYVNHMPAGQGWSNHGELERVLNIWTNRYSDHYLSAPEDAGLRARFRMKDENGNPIGRLHIFFQPAYRATDHLPIFIMNLTGRGKPNPPDMDGVMTLFSREHEWIVKGFTSMTTPHMHEIWGRKDV
jgi:uncharacterized protein (TIGR04255 family)